MVRFFRWFINTDVYNIWTFCLSCIGTYPIVKFIKGKLAKSEVAHSLSFLLMAALLYILKPFVSLSGSRVWFIQVLTFFPVYLYMFCFEKVMELIIYRAISAFLEIKPVKN
jgi:hypothetical protein